MGPFIRKKQTGPFPRGGGEREVPWSSVHCGLGKRAVRAIIKGFKGQIVQKSRRNGRTDTPAGARGVHKLITKNNVTHSPK